ncbi:MAG: pyridoxine 5'-phosphate synthase [Gemmatimonas sp.]|uniref:pyridoxine 5'-phosphate synthase n=1 Tax=Gemmatimonas sp. TaxID=1962908 RepID=UPI00391EF6E1|nr:pyridoxine 5'-phosphate synthase [Gemmatimonadota bacterium]
MTSLRYQRLYVNIDHVATVRQARRSREPDPVAAALLCERAGADGITAHLREDRRHVQDEDIHRLAAAVSTVLNLECALTDEMLALAETLRPPQVTLVPERREEVTTEGGLDVVGHEGAVRSAVARLKRGGVRTSLFIDPDPAAVRVALAVGADAIELHTGRYAHAPSDPATLRALRDAAQLGASLGLAVHAGHGLSVDNVRPVAAIPEIEELNIGHAIIGRAIFVGLDAAVREVRSAMDEARAAHRY